MNQKQKYIMRQTFFISVFAVAVAMFAFSYCDTNLLSPEFDVQYESGPLTAAGGLCDSSDSKHLYTIERSYQNPVFGDVYDIKDATVLGTWFEDSAVVQNPWELIAADLGQSVDSICNGPMLGVGGDINIMGRLRYSGPYPENWGDYYITIDTANSAGEVHENTSHLVQQTQ